MSNIKHHNLIQMLLKTIITAFVCLLFYHLFLGYSLGIKYYVYFDGKWIIISRILLLIILFKQQNFKHIIALDIGILLIWVMTMTGYHQNFSDIKNINHFFKIIFGHFLSGIVYFYIFYNMLLANNMIFYIKKQVNNTKTNLAIIILSSLYIAFFIGNI